MRCDFFSADTYIHLSVSFDVMLHDCMEIGVGLDWIMFDGLCDGLPCVFGRTAHPSIFTPGYHTRFLITSLIC